MLWFRYQQGIEFKEVELHVGQKLKGFINSDTIKMVTADGQEAEQALRMVGKHATTRVVKFFGDDARFIVANWS